MHSNENNTSSSKNKRPLITMHCGVCNRSAWPVVFFSLNKTKTGTLVSLTAGSHNLCATAEQTWTNIQDTVFCSLNVVFFWVFQFMLKTYTNCFISFSPLYFGVAFTNYGIIEFLSLFSFYFMFRLLEPMCKSRRFIGISLRRLYY